MNRGQSIRLFLVDGTPSGLWIAEIMGKTIRATVFPRNSLDTLTKRPEVHKTGIYVLSGTDQNNPLRQTIYIGQSENAWGRLRQHDADENKDFWKRTVIFTSNDANLTKSHVLYLESRLIELANASSRATIENGMAPALPALPESEQAYMEEWLDWVKILLPVLGYDFAVPVPDVATDNEEIKPISQDVTPTLKLKMDKVGVNAKLHQINGEWIIISGSTMRKETQASLSDSLVELRKSLLSDGIIIEDETNENYWKFVKNYPATSLSMAASLIAGAQYSGPGAWVIEETNEAYWQWRKRQLDEAEKQLSAQIE
jgi:predicted GIY-YIG superfamily endonuclease